LGTISNSSSRLNHKIMDRILTVDDPKYSDFKITTFSGGLPTVVKAYRINGIWNITAATEAGGIITVTTSKAHNIALTWVVGTTYAADVFVKYLGKLYKSLQAANVGKYPTYEPLWWEYQEMDAEEGSEVVDIEAVAGMTDINNQYTVLSTPAATTFTFAQVTIQAYTSGGKVSRGVFVFKRLFEYDAAFNLIGDSIYYTDI